MYYCSIKHYISGTKFDLDLPQHFAFMDAGLPKHLGGCEAEELTCSSSTSPPQGPFIGPLLPSSMSDGGGNEAEEALGQINPPAPVVAINNIIDNLSESCDNVSSMEQ